MFPEYDWKDIDVYRIIKYYFMLNMNQNIKFRITDHVRCCSVKMIYFESIQYIQMYDKSRNVIHYDYCVELFRKTMKYKLKLFLLMETPPPPDRPFMCVNFIIKTV